MLLLAGCIASAAVAMWAGDPAGFVRADPELALLLRGMAAIKAALVLAAVAVLWWRLGHPIAPPTTAAYLAGAWLATGATLLVWQLTLIPLAALVFHVGELTLLFVAWRDQQDRAPRAQVTRQGTSISTQD
jgi:hypothetical protein